jgi:hypothetical protein
MRQTRPRLRQGHEVERATNAADDDFGYNETGPCSGRRLLGP